MKKEKDLFEYTNDHLDTHSTVHPRSWRVKFEDIENFSLDLENLLKKYEVE